MINWREICNQIQQVCSLRLDSHLIQNVGGGCINAAYLVGNEQQRVFVKTNQQSMLKMFEAEAKGLNTMALAEAILVPEVYCVGSSENTAFIAMQAFNFGHGKTHSYRDFGVRLANLHRFQQSRFGADVDNTIGSTPQYNQWMENWFDFWREHRLGFQLDLAKHNRAPIGLIDDGFKLAEKMEQLFDDTPAAACLHGDLWNGNWAFNQNGQPVIFDPAHYFGDRETDIAMTKLFGRAHADFYAAYHDAYPLSDNYTTRETFYNTYHILNHYNLFGGGYAEQAHRMIKNLLSELN